MFIKIIILSISIFFIKQAFCSGDEYRLLQDLFERRDGGYNPRIRPVENISKYIEIGFEMALIQLINLDERNQIMKTNVWLRLRWCDYQLQWKHSEYGFIDWIRIQPDRVWKPDIVLYNNADGRFEVSFKANVLIQNNGFVMWIPCTIYKSSCNIDVTYFPFDEQICEMNFASWTYNSKEVKLNWYLPKVNESIYSMIDLSDYEKSGSWDLVDIPGTITEKDNRTFINYYLKLRRKTLFYTVNLIIPCLLISILSTAVFYVPVDAGEKTTMSVSILLALVVFLQVLVTNLLPPSSTSFPLFAKYLLFTVVLDTCAVVNVIFVLNWHFKTPRTHKMPRWARLVFIDVLPRILFMTRPTSESSSCSEELGKANAMTPESGRRAAMKPQMIDLSDVHAPNCKMHNKGKRQYRDEEEEMIRLQPEINKAVEAVRFISAHLKNEDDYDEVIDDWRYIAQVIDRLLFFIYLLVTIATTLSILLNAPNIFEFVNQDAFKSTWKEFHKKMILDTLETFYGCDYG